MRKPKPTRQLTGRQQSWAGGLPALAERRLAEPQAKRADTLAEPQTKRADTLAEPQAERAKESATCAQLDSETLRAAFKERSLRRAH